MAYSKGDFRFQTVVNRSSEMEERLEDVREKLNKKKTFEQALIDLQQLLVEIPELSTSVPLSALVQRTFTLLKTRYTAPAFWSAGKKLYQAVKVRHLALLLHEGPFHSKLFTCKNI
jgi:hypothetical protein